MPRRHRAAFGLRFAPVLLRRNFPFASLSRTISNDQTIAMKVVINKCFGGFSLSAKAVQRMAELQGRQCYFYESTDPLTLINGIPTKRWSWCAFDTPDMADVYREACALDGRGTHKNGNAVWEKHHIDNRPTDRTDPALIQAVEELGEEANGDCAELGIVDVPDGVSYEISEYDGREHIAEVHRTWS